MSGDPVQVKTPDSQLWERSRIAILRMSEKDRELFAFTVLAKCIVDPDVVYTLDQLNAIARGLNDGLGTKAVDLDNLPVLAQARAAKRDARD